MHPTAGIQLSEDDKVAILQQGRAQLWIALLSPEGARFTIMDTYPSPTPPDQPKQTLTKACAN